MMKLISYQNPRTQAVDLFDSLFDLSQSGSGRLGAFLESFVSPESTSFRPLVDLFEDDGHFYACFELPGVDKEGVEIELKQSVLTIRSVETSTTDDSSSEQIQFERSVRVPAEVDASEVSATMQNGLLKVTLPKLPAAQVRKIEIS